MGYWEQIGVYNLKRAGEKRRDWLGIIAWPAALVFYIVVGGALLKLLGFI